MCYWTNPFSILTRGFSFFVKGEKPVNTQTIEPTTVGTIFRIIDEHDGNLILSPRFGFICIPFEQGLLAFPNVYLDGQHENPLYRRILLNDQFFGVFIPVGMKVDPVEKALVAEGLQIIIWGSAWHEIRKILH